jgi:hypothetical protein
MRSIGAPLTTAQAQPARAPYVTAVVQNNVEHVRRLDFTSLNSTVNAAGKHDICVAADGSVTRVRITGGIVKQQRLTLAQQDTPANWDTWNDLITGVSTQVACAAIGTRVIVVYSKAGANVNFKESTDSGVNYGADTNAFGAAATPQDLAVAYKNSAGDLMIFAAETGTLEGIKRTAGVFGGGATHPTITHSLTGIAACFAFDYELIITGTEVTTVKPTVWTLIYGDGSGAALDVWTTPRIQVQGIAALTTFQSPSLEYLDTYRANFTEVAAYVGGTTRAYRMWLHPTNLYQLGDFTWRTPLPVNNAFANGIARAHGPTYAYESSLAPVNRADWTLVTKDIAPDLIGFELYEDTLDAHGWNDVRNTITPAGGGNYAGPASPIVVGAQVKIAIGYYTSAGNVASPLQDFWITAIEHRREMRPGKGKVTLRLFVEGGLRRLRRSYQREQINHPGTVDDYRTVLSGILNRAGMVLSVTTASSRSDTVLPKFLILPAHSGHDAARTLLSFLADRMIAKSGGTVSLHEPLTSETSDFAADEAVHPVYARHLRIAPPPVSEAHANALDAAGALILGHATDYATAEYGTAPLERQRDLSSDTAAEANATAVAHLRQRKLEEDAGDIVVGPICGLELLDMISFTDALIAAGVTLKRTMSITWRLDRTRGVYEQQIGLGPP